MSLNEEKSETNSEETQQIEIDTKLTFLNSKYYFHDLFKQSEFVKHHIVEDMEFDADYMDEDHVFHYLK